MTHPSHPDGPATQRDAVTPRGVVSPRRAATKCSRACAVLVAAVTGVSTPAGVASPAAGAARPGASPVVRPAARPAATLDAAMPTATTPAAPFVTAVAQPSLRGRVERGEEQLDLYVGQAHVLDEADVKRIVIGNGRVIQATALDDRQML